MEKKYGFWSRIWKFLKRPYGWGGLLVIIVLCVVLFGHGAPKLQTVTIENGTIAQTVVVTGQITAAKNVSLSFEQTGRIGRIYVTEGDHVAAGDPLIAEDGSTATAQLQKDQANLSAAQANLAILQSGATPQSIAVAAAQVETAKEGLVTAIKNAYAAADDAVHNQTDPIFTNPRTNPQLVFQTGDPQVTNTVQNERLAVENTLSVWESSLNTLATSSDLASAARAAGAALEQEQSFLSDASAAVNLASPTAGLTQTTINTWKTNIAAGRTEVNAALTNVTSAAATFTVDQKNLILTQAPPTADQVTASEAAVAQAQAQVAFDQAALGKTVIRSPFDALVTNVIPQLGETVTSGEEVVDLIGTNTLQVEAYVPEIDVAKLSVGDLASMTFDALPNETFTGKVATIYPAETVLNGVANYKIEVAFDKMDPRFKSGLTANLTIETMKKDNVLVLPQYALIENDQGTFAEKIENGKPVQVPVTLGIRDDNGNAEVLSGLQAGDRVVNIGLNQ
ncbi:efflux RND transporter periplasmic adaptor subunit [Patescibacteria group bacterium]|nr:efflux RND transporter periplasmic adaptor subunit [Patescibacteria group bacterium]